MAGLGGIKPEEMDKARRALRAFRNLQPTLTAYAQMLTGRPDVTVVAAAHDNGSTDGTRIFYRPPIGLGTETMHEKWNCDKRDESGHRMCPACRQREEVLTTIYHEISHIWFRSFEVTSEVHRVQVLEQAIRERGGKYSEAIEKKIKAAPWRTKESYMGLAGLISEFLPIIINAMEDARVNRELFRALPGTKIMFDASTMRVFEEGVEQQNSRTGVWEKILWRDYKPNMQAIVGVFCKASGYDYATWFMQPVVDALDDDQLGSIVARVDVTTAISEIYGLSFEVLARLRELGFCRLPEDPEVDEPPPPLPSPPAEPEESNDGPEGDSPGEPGSGEESEDKDTDEGGRETGESDHKDSGDGPDHEGDDDTSSGDDSGEGDHVNKDHEASDSTDEAREQSEEVADDDSEGPESDNPETEGSAGGGDRDEELDEPAADSGGSDAGPGDEELEKGLHGADSSGEDGSPEDSGEWPEDADDWVEGKGTEGSSSPDPRDDDTLGEEGLDPDDGEASGPEESDKPVPPTEPDGDGRDESGALDSGSRVTPDSGGSAGESEDMGSPEECKVAVHKFGDHEEKTPEEVAEEERDAEVITTALVQAEHFDMPSMDVFGATQYGFPDGQAWSYYARYIRDKRANSDTMSDLREYGIVGEFDPSEAVLAPARLRARIAFADNARARHQTGLKAGKVNGRVLGKRAPLDDPRLMRRKVMPGKKSFFVLIGIDVSGSTVGNNLKLAKQVALAEAELLHGLGIKFAVYAHSGGHAPAPHNSMLDLRIYVCKDPDELWTNGTRDRVRSLGPDAANLDGHTMEYYRKVLDRRPETTKIMHYYTDGAMPFENFNEELAILKREIKTCRQKQYTVLGVGICTDAPKQHGLETVEVNTQADVLKVITHLEKNLIM